MDDDGRRRRRRALAGLEIRPLLEAHDDHDDVLDRLDALDPVRAERDGRAAERLDRALMAATVSSGQARLLHRPDIMAAIDDVATNPDAGVRRGRPRRRRHT